VSPITSRMACSISGDRCLPAVIAPPSGWRGREKKLRDLQEIYCGLRRVRVGLSWSTFFNGPFALAGGGPLPCPLDHVCCLIRWLLFHPRGDESVLSAAL